MAEARTEEEEENMRRESREQVVRRQPCTSGGRPDRRKPEHRHSQGPLSSIRAVIKRTSTRTTSLSETSRERERDRDRDRERDRRRPEITILSAEPLASAPWFPGASGGFPPPPPPAAQIWGSTIPPAIQPPPSYEEVIREKTQEQVVLPSSSSSSSLSSLPISTTTIATQTDTGAAPGPPESPGDVRRPVRPPRPPLPSPPRSSLVDDVAPSQSTLPLRPEPASAFAPCCDLLGDLCSPSTSADVVPCPPAAPVLQERPRPRPRSKIGVRPIGSEVKVQTLVKLREDGLATLAAAQAARSGSDAAGRDSSQGTYLQELLDAFGGDDWGFPDRRSDSSDLSQSESEEEEEEEDMATLRARIQAFEQQVADGSSGVTEGPPNPSAKPEPRPRPRLQGQPSKPAPPVVAPKPKNFSSGPKPSSKVFWEDAAATGSPVDHAEPDSAGVPLKTETPPASEPPPCRSSAKPPVTPKPQTTPEAPVPAPRPPPPKLATPVSDGHPPSNPRPPPRPSVTPRASPGASPQDKSAANGGATPALPPRPSPEACSAAQTAPTRTGSEESQTGKAGSIRPDVPTKPAALSSPRRSSAPNIAPKPTGVSSTPPEDSHQGSAKPPGPARTQPSAPAPASRKGPVGPTRAETPHAENPSDPGVPGRTSSVKLLPLRPPPIKSNPGRPPPPGSSSASSANQISPLSKTVDAPPVTPASSSPSPATADQTQTQKAPKRGPPLPPRPKPGHPLYSSYVKQEVLIVLDDPSPAPSELAPVEESPQTAVTNPSECLLDLDTRPEAIIDPDGQTKAALEGLSDSQSILPVRPVEQKEQPDPPPVSGPRCVAAFDYEGEEEDELTFSQGDVIALLELLDGDWGRGRIHGREGIFPLGFTEVVEALPQSRPDPAMENTAAPKSSPASDSQCQVTPGSDVAPAAAEEEEEEEWDEALFDFPGQTAEDLSFQKGALIRVMEHVDGEWRRGRVDGKEGLYPAAFTQPSLRPPPAGGGSARAVFDFTAENQDELTLKVGDIVTQVESVDEQWIVGVVAGKRGIVPKNYISLL
ncbi:SH3 domain-containing protein 19-like isoform X1 [Salarias fasciatus]|uniref:SH3 domain-containing protein 19-like isoform X1 n=1 Tax=Salarias fasciatus TaxID=181472 RepID=UPI001176E305|nr:SH3 domain-containing protein 19-like isoform X1 [Salarias fasciatus]